MWGVLSLIYFNFEYVLTNITNIAKCNSINRNIINKKYDNAYKEANLNLYKL